MYFSLANKLVYLYTLNFTKAISVFSILIYNLKKFYGGSNLEFRWIEKEELMQKYKVIGSFYNVLLTPTQTIQCRNSLHIYDKEHKDIYETENRPELLVIMMNPGNSEPLDPNYKIPIYTGKNVPNKIRETNNVETVPDPTQYQIMRIMWNMDYSHAQIINISNLRNPISSNFTKQLNLVHPLNDIHSIFSNKRRHELTDIFLNLRNNTIILKAWGIAIVNNNTYFKGLVETCLHSISTNQKHIGLKGESNLHFRHPLPFPSWIPNKQKEWLINIGTLFRE